MTDVFSEEKRSWIMGKVKGENTSVEMKVRRLIHRLGYRYRLHRRDLPGKPDIVFSRRKKAIFVHGCFWHGHDCARGRRIPKTNREYWLMKISGNVRRDAAHREAFRLLNWEALVVWECEIKDLERLSQKIILFLGPRV